MAGRTTWLLILSTAFAGLVACVSAHIKCKDLPINACAFSVSSSGMRCILEKVISTEGQPAYECQTSEVLATEFAEWVETDECVSSCGVDRMTVGMSSDSLIEKGFVAKLCSDGCRKECPNVMDLFEKLSAEEGAPLRRVCEAQSMGDARREMSEIGPHFASLSVNTLSAFDFPNANSPSASLNPQGLAASAPSPSPL